ncbi:LysM peptidoglycan-binding domain-containing protein [Alteromonas ponticola]|uniref:LysM peptidoglycan-binding domain-containing protein n=1 Tax=Alteromonas aquimaris TaxID=2998417 RepID=A0ABT3P7Y6_9ALTE|nr:LysM domain-containing protein [Alteromonas aquimaris]MCW8108845.1 LysM peptidoglycan-binding domain-containing protein [Alteromonas aquimaris]
MQGDVSANRQERGNTYMIFVKKLISKGACLLTLLTFVVAGFAMAQQVDIRPSAPKTYTVKKNDTLWDIASLFLDKPWLWPELWRKNTQISNPHLIYPGDVLTIRYVDGQPILEVVRNKKQLTLTPTTVTETKPQPISVLPWSAIATYVNQNELLAEENYSRLPYLLGNQEADMRFVEGDLVLSRKMGRPEDQYRVIRKQSTIKDFEGNVLGVQVHHVADATMVEDKAADQWLVKVDKSNFEAQRGDKLYAGKFTDAKDLTLAAATSQRGHIVGNLHEHTLTGKHDVVIVDIGNKQIAPGTVMGIYTQGPDIIDGHTPRYSSETNVVKSVFNDGSTVKQPALKVGELIIFKTFEKASYGIITRAKDSIQRGAIVANP